MTTARFLQIHTLHSYSAALLNRDDSGLAKRVMYGGAMRTRISSQCLKRHWRKAEDPHALLEIPGAEDAFRSRQLVTEKIVSPYLQTATESDANSEVVDALVQWFNYAIYSGNPKEKPKSRGVAAKADAKENRPTLLFGNPELAWLSREFGRLAQSANGDPERAFQLGRSWVEGAVKEDGNTKNKKEKRVKSGYNDVIAELRKTATFRAALPSALFGRMVTSDPAANIDAPIHVAHAFTVHEEETESDYFTAVDDLKREEDDSGADTIQEAELTSGLFYGYVVVDVPGLVSNLTGFERREWEKADRAMAAAVVHNLIYLIAEVSPGAKLGSTAPYGRAELVLVEAGDRQPRSLAAAFREPVTPSLPATLAATKSHLAMMDRLYETGEARRALSTGNDELPGASRGSLREIAEWAKAAVTAGKASP